MDIGKLKIAFNTLDSIDPTDELAYEKAFIAFNSIGHLPIFIDTVENSKVFRTRTHDTADHFTNISDIAITPRKFVKDFARCNRPFQSIFYSSENRPTSFMELLEYWSETKNFGDKLYITIGLWETTKPVNLIIVTTPDILKRESQFDKYHGVAYDEHLKKRSKEEQEFSAVFFNYLFDKFRKPAKHDLKTYIITSAYANIAITQAKELADGISYPSVPFNGNGVNLALKESYSKTLKLTQAMWTQFEITPTDEGKHNFTESKSILTEKIDLTTGKIQW